MSGCIIVLFFLSAAARDREINCPHPTIFSWLKSHCKTGVVHLYVFPLQSKQQQGGEGN